jgi:hypothetical protein
MMAANRFVRVADSTSALAIRHVRFPNGSLGCKAVLDGPVSENSHGPRCEECQTALKRWFTPEGRLVYQALGTTDVSKDVMKLATYVTEERRKLATQLREVTERVAALYPDG